MSKSLAPISRLPAVRGDLFPSFEQEFDRFFSDFWSPSQKDRLLASKYPRLDAMETDDHYIINVAVPGVKIDDLIVEIIPTDDHETRSLRISGKMSAEYKSDNDSYFCKELVKSAFSRTVSLPDFAEGNPEAELKDGILQLKWKNRKPPSVKNQRIEIKQIT